MSKKSLLFDLAEDLYVVDGLTLEQVAARLPEKVSVTTLSGWKQDGEWEERRREWAKAQADIKRDSLKLRQTLMKNALESGLPQAVYAFCTLETTLARINARGLPVAAASPSPDTVREIKTPQDAVAALEEVVQARVNTMLGQPETLTMPAIKDLKQTLELIENLKTRYRPDEKTGEAPGLSDAAADEIRRQILGIAG